MVPGDFTVSKKYDCKQKYLNNIFSLDCDWIWIGLSIHFENWIWIWIDNHKFVKDLDWIENPKNWIEQYPAYMKCERNNIHKVIWEGRIRE